MRTDVSNNPSYSMPLSSSDSARRGRGKKKPHTGTGEEKEEEEQISGVQAWVDGAQYEGGVVNGVKHGTGKYTWKNGEYYQGSFYQDYRHGKGIYCWPAGHRFTGKFYLNRKEGYGTQQFADGTTFQGLYHDDERFGPGVLSYPDGRQDVGLWHGERLIRLCTALEGSFNLSLLPEYAADVGAVVTANPPPEVETEPLACSYRDLPMEGHFALPFNLECYSADSKEWPLSPACRRELDRLFFSHQGEPEPNQHLHSVSPLPLLVRMQAHIDTHSPEASRAGWAVAEVLSSSRDRFGAKGPAELSSEAFIQQATAGDLQGLCRTLRTGMVDVDVGDALGHTALIAATVNCNQETLQLLLDSGANIDQLNCEGMSALAVCHVLYYPRQAPELHGPPDSAVMQPKAASLAGSSSSTIPGDTPRGAGELHTGPETSGTSQDNNGIPPDQPSLDSLDSSFHSLSADDVTAVATHTESQDALCTMSAMKPEHHRSMLELLLACGADPNASSIPVPVLLMAVLAADVEVVRLLLQAGARTDVPLPPERGGLYPLHISAALPGSEGPGITEMLLQANAHPDTQALEELYDQGTQELEVALKSKGAPLLFLDTPSCAREVPVGGGRTALHVTCLGDRDDSHSVAVATVLLSHGANTGLLWARHSPLSLAIANGNLLVVEELLKAGAEPNLPLAGDGRTALCVLVSLKHDLDTPQQRRTRLLDMLLKAGANIMMPVMMSKRNSRALGTVVDYAHYCFEKDTRISQTSYHILTVQERDTFDTRHQLLSTMADQLRLAVGNKEREVHRAQQGSLAETRLPTSKIHRKVLFKYCYQCGRSVFVVLTPCSTCHRVFFCSEACKVHSWKDRHKDECRHKSGGI